MIFRHLTTAALAAVAFMATAGAQAAQFAFNVDNTEIATLTVTQSGADLLFSLDAADLDALGTTTFLGALGIDGIKQGAIANVSGGAPVALHNGGGPNGVNFRFDLTGPKQARLTDGETVSWTWSGSGQSLASLGFSAHIQAIGPKGDSLWVTATPVPEASTYAMALAGLGVASLLARSRRVQG